MGAAWLKFSRGHEEPLCVEVESGQIFVTLEHEKSLNLSLQILTFVEIHISDISLNSDMSEIFFVLFFRMNQKMSISVAESDTTEFLLCVR